MRKSIIATLCLFTSGCVVGPKYQKPVAPASPEFKEANADFYKEMEGWKQAQPSDSQLKGKWWEVYNEPDLNALEEQVSISNENVLTAEAQFRAARAAVRIARSALYPTVGSTPAITNSRSSTAGQTIFPGSSGVRSLFDLPVDATWTADLWGSIHRGVTASSTLAQASFAQLENARLLYQSELAVDYFQLRGLDGDAQLLDTTAKSYEKYLELTRNRYTGGIASEGDVAQAETQLDTTKAQLIDIGVQRAQLEHAIAILTGKPPSAFSMAPAPLKTPPPPIPVGLPSDLLERRPDIAAAEREAASANEQIGIAMAAYYPTLTLSATGGLQSGNIQSWFTWPARFWSLGPQLSETLFDAGKRRATVIQTQASFDATAATYRQTVLTAFQQVEDNLAALHVLSNEAEMQAEAVKAAERSLKITTDQYKGGITSYLQVITTQTTALADERAAVDILTRRMTASVQLIEALGGGWNAAKLPSEQDLLSATAKVKKQKQAAQP
jgi:NodT family efflux transporter outer membrane factor (OMF) lipoprotein